MICPNYLIDSTSQSILTGRSICLYIQDSHRPSSGTKTDGHRLRSIYDWPNKCSHKSLYVCGTLFSLATTREEILLWKIQRVFPRCSSTCPQFEVIIVWRMASVVGRVAHIPTFITISIREKSSRNLFRCLKAHFMCNTKWSLCRCNDMDTRSEFIQPLWRRENTPSPSRGRECNVVILN